MMMLMILIIYNIILLLILNLQASNSLILLYNNWVSFLGGGGESWKTAKVHKKKRVWEGYQKKTTPARVLSGLIFL